MGIRVQAAPRVWKEGSSFLFFLCSCGHEQAANPGMPWCSACSTEYDSDGGSVTLRPGRRTARFAVAKALNATGGVRIGPIPRRVEWPPESES